MEDQTVGDFGGLVLAPTPGRAEVQALLPVHGRQSTGETVEDHEEAKDTVGMEYRMLIVSFFL